MNLKEIKEAQQGGSPVNFMGRKCIIYEICNEYTGTDCVTTVTLVHAEKPSWKCVTTELESITPWEEPTNKGENTKTQEQKTLELIKAALAGETILWMEESVTYQEGSELIQAIVDYPNHYSIKPKTKTVNYQTRLYETTEGNFRIWNSHYGYSQKSIENFLEFKGWLESTQECSCEYEVK